MTEFFFIFETIISNTKSTGNVIETRAGENITLLFNSLRIEYNVSKLIGKYPIWKRMVYRG